MKPAVFAPTDQSVSDFLATLTQIRQTEAEVLITTMKSITNNNPVMWGASIVGYGSQHYKYDTGREGDMPRLAFSPRKAAITIYFNEGFDRYGELLAKLGKYKSSVSCLYINKLADVDMKVLEAMLKASYDLGVQPRSKISTVEEYIHSVPAASKKSFNDLRKLVTKLLPNSQEVLSYGIIGYKIDDKRARVYISGWKDHVAMYPVPKDPALQAELKPYIKGKGTLWFPLDKPLPTPLINRAVRDLVKT